MRHTVDLAEVEEDLAFRHHIYDTEKLFGLYRLMMRTAAERGPRWKTIDPARHFRYPEVHRAIGGDGEATSTFPAPFSSGWRKSLTSRLLHALRDDGAVKRWREEHGFGPKGSKVVPGPFSHGSAEELDALFALASPERRTLVSYNPVHPDARRVVGVRLGLSKDLWWAQFSYGFDGSSWDDAPVVSQAKGESFGNFIRRATAELGALLTRPCARVDHYGRTLLPARWPRMARCSAGFTGTLDGREVVGGVDLATFAEGVVFTAPGFVMLPGIHLPVELEEEGGGFVETPESSERTARPGDYITRKKIDKATAQLGFARYLLHADAIRRSYLDISPGGRDAADKVLAPGEHGGSAVREEREARRFQEIRPTAFEGWMPRGAQATCEP